MGIWGKTVCREGTALGHGGSWPLAVGLSAAGLIRRLPARRGGGAVLPDGAGSVLQYFWEVKAARDGCEPRGHRRGCGSMGRSGRSQACLCHRPHPCPRPRGLWG